MEFLYSVFVIAGIILLIIAIAASKNGYVFFSIAIGLCLVLFFDTKTKELKKGEPAPSLNVLTTGEKYEIVDIYEKYIIIKSVADDRLKLIGPLDFGKRTATTGRYIKTAEESLVKIE